MKLETILLIEDDLLFAKVFERKLSVIGDFEIHHCTSVEDGLVFIETTKPELIFMDHELGGVNGVDAIHLFKGALSNAEICIVSGQRDPAVLGKALDNDVKYFRKDALLLKNTEEFISEVKNKPSQLNSFWGKFLDHYKNSIPEHS